MGSTNYGNQSIYIAYDLAATSSNFNKRYSKIIQEGIYEGGTLYIDSGDDILIGVFICFARASSGEGVKIETSSNVSLTLSESTPYVIGRYSWLNSSSNYMDFYAVAAGSIASNDIVFGKGTYVGGVLTSFDYADKTWGIINQDGDIYANRHIIAKEDGIVKTIYMTGDTSGQLDSSDYSGAIGITGVSVSAAGGGNGTILMVDGSNRNSAGFIKGYIGETEIYIPYFTAVGV